MEPAKSAAAIASGLAATITKELVYQEIIAISQRLQALEGKYEYLVVNKRVYRLLDRIANPWKGKRTNWLRRKR